MPQNIVILGASFAGTLSAHYIMQKVLPSLPSKETYHVYVVDRSDKFFNNIPTPRALSNSELMTYDKLFIPYTQVFAKYPDTQFTFVQARITGLDLENRTIALDRVAGGPESLPYYALLIATGNQFASPLWYIEESAEHTQKQIASLESSLATARTVLIAGGGAVGVETAGEVGEQLNGTAGWFSSEPAHKKAEVTLYSGSTKLLPRLSSGLAKKAERFLKRVGVDVVHQVKIVSATPTSSGQTLVRLSNGQSKTVDVYIPAHGARPATSWAPEALLNSNRRIANHPQTLRVEAPEAGPRVYAVGDVGSHSKGDVMNVYSAIPVVGENLKRDLLLAGGAEKGASAAAADKEFKNGPDQTQFVPVGRGKGVASVMGWSIPSVFVWMLKGRDYMVAMGRPKILGTEV